MIFNFNIKKAQGGFLVLTMVLLVCATVLIIVTGILLRSISGTKNGEDTEQALKAWSVVNACGEHALLQMSALNGMPGWNYASTTGESLSVGAETCYIYPVDDGGAGEKIIKASSTVSGFTRKILIEVATNTPNIVVNSWEIVADF